MRTSWLSSCVVTISSRSITESTACHIERAGTQVMNRLKALYRGRGIACAGHEVYVPLHRSEWLGKISEAGVRRRAEHCYQQLDVLRLLRQQVRRERLLGCK